MTGYSFFSSLGALLLFLVHLAVIARVILRPHREPASRIAWIVLILVLPVAGMIAYLLLGEMNIGRRRARRLQEVLAHNAQHFAEFEDCYGNNPQRPQQTKKPR
jgi:cardiolipin synthase A/B